MAQSASSELIKRLNSPLFSYLSSKVLILGRESFKTLEVCFTYFPTDFVLYLFTTCQWAKSTSATWETSALN